MFGCSREDLLCITFRLPLTTLPAVTSSRGYVYKQEPLPHYENLPMQYIEMFLAVKIENFARKILII